MPPMSRRGQDLRADRQDNVQGSLFPEPDALASFAVRYLRMNGRSVRTVTQLAAPTMVSAHDVTEKAGSMTSSA